MEIQFFGANCFKIQTKQATFVVDENLQSLGLKSVAKSDDIALITNSKLLDTGEHEGFVIDGPGEYEVKGVSISGIPSRAHIDESGKAATMYVVHIDDLSIAVLGHIYPELSDDQLEAIGIVDVLLIPVGGSGYTLDPVGATSLIKKIEPKVVIPSHYETNGVAYEVPQLPVESFLNAIGANEPERMASFKIKPTELSEKLRVIVLEPKI